MSSSSNTASSVYSVCFFHQGHYLACSNAFETKAEANQFVDYCKTMDPSKLTFNMYKHTAVGCSVQSKFTQTTQAHSEHHSEHRSEPQVEVKTDLSDMTLERYGKGFLLRPPSDSSLYGVKEFINGWWMPKHHAWFFKSQYFDDLVMYGAEYISDIPVDHDRQVNSNNVKVDTLVEDYNSEQSDADSDYHPDEHEEPEDELEYASDDGIDYGDQVQGMVLERYGKGWMLYPNSEEDDIYGMKYFGNGFWNRRAKGWFFRNGDITDLVEAGAYVIEDDECELTESMKEHGAGLGHWTTYGRGWLFKPVKDHPSYGQKYFKNGFWMNKHSAWFFKNKDAEKLR